jgi:hypothetical protein
LSSESLCTPQRARRVAVVMMVTIRPNCVGEIHRETRT